MGFPEGELSLLIVDDSQIAVLNEEYRAKKGPTNVLAFSMREGRFADIAPQLLGDVVISVEAAQREGAATGIPLEDRFSKLLVHGILHLFGYDHEKTEEEAVEMEEKTSELWKLVENI